MIKTKVLLTAVFVNLFLLVHTQDSLKTSDFTIGESVTFYSTSLEENRTLNIYLPKGYHKDSAQQYAVIYLLDGSENEDFIHISGLVQFCSFDWIQTLPKTIVVGIENVDRVRDFTYASQLKSAVKDFPTAGGSKKFIQYIENEVQPYIDSTYNTDTLSTLIGQSLGGLLASEVALHHTELFDQYIIVSPSLWWDEASLLSLNKEDYQINSPVYLGVGKEGEIMERDAKNLYEKIVQASPENNRIYFQFFEQYDHGNVLHQATYEAFKVLFKSEK